MEGEGKLVILDAFLGMNGVVGEGRGVKKLENWGDGP